MLRNGVDMAYLLLCIDDMVLTASSTNLLHDVIARLKMAFTIKDMGPLRYFLGIDMRWDHHGFFLS